MYEYSSSQIHTSVFIIHTLIRVYMWYTHTCIHIWWTSVTCITLVFSIHVYTYAYGVATVSRIDSIIGLFCRISSLSSGSFAKETYNFIDPTNQSHPIYEYWILMRVSLNLSRCIIIYVYTYAYMNTDVCLFIYKYRQLQIRWHRILRLF